mgnify:CR=1 FL=1
MWLRRDDLVFPARAGMILSRAYVVEDLPGIPRESGDDPPTAAYDPRPLRYSPRERG